MKSENMLDLIYTSATEPSCAAAYNTVYNVIKNPNNLVGKTEEYSYDFASSFHYIVWSPKGEQIFVIPDGAFEVRYANTNIIFPKELSENINRLLKQRVVTGKELTTKVTNLLVSNMKRFKER